VSDEIELPEDKIKEINMEVVRLTAEGRTKQYIKSQTGVSPAEQRKINEEYKAFVRNDLWTAQRSREIVGYMDEHFGSIITQLYEVVSAADMADDYKNKGNALKLIAEVEAKRVDALQKAGVLSATNIGDEVAESNRKQEIIINILKEVSQRWPDAGKFIAAEIAKMNGEVIPTRGANG